MSTTGVPAYRPHAVPGPPTATAGRARRHSLRVVCLCDDDEFVQLRRALHRRQPPTGAGRAGMRSRTRIELSRAPGYGGIEELPVAAWSFAAQVVLLGERELQDPRTAERVALLQRAGIRVRAARDFAEQHAKRVALDGVAPAWFLFDIRRHHHAGYRCVTTLLDVLAGLVATVLLLLVGPLIALAVAATSRGPVLYRQQRLGLHGQLFHIVKFRTMVVDAEVGGPRLATVADQRITWVGAFLRRSRLDELPQAWNLLRREMSLIGPRPERPEFADFYAVAVPFYSHRLAVRPGVTGWAQVTEGYTDDLSGTVHKVERDLYYVKHQNLWFDLVILARTVLTVLRFSGR